MREGCLIGCLGLIAVTMVLAIVTVAVLDAFLGIFREADRVSLADMYGTDHDVMMLIEPDAAFVSGVSETAAEGTGWIVEWVLPHELTMFADADRETGSTDITVAASMRRMAGFLSYSLPEPEGMTVFDGAEVTGLGVKSNGVAYLNGTKDVAPELLERAASMTAVSADVPYTLEGGHLGEVIMNNTGGDAFIAIEQLFTGPAQGEETPLLTQEQEQQLGENVTSGRLVFDLVDEDSLSMDVDMRLTDPDRVHDFVPMIDDVLRNLIVKENNRESTKIEGNIEPTEYGVSGKYIFRSVQKPLANHWEKAVEEFESVQDRGN